MRADIILYAVQVKEQNTVASMRVMLFEAKATPTI